MTMASDAQTPVSDTGPGSSPGTSRGTSLVPVVANTSVLASEAAHFGGMAGDWWDPKGSSAMLHRLNPVRLGYIRGAVDAHWGSDAAAFRPLEGRTALDVGCGAGLLAEPLARLGAKVTGIDAAAENIAVAAQHAVQSGLTIDYRSGGIEAAGAETFDLVTCLEVIEHVADPGAFVRGLAGAVAPGGLLILSTPNRTAFSRTAMIMVAEGTGMIPRGTHDWSRFLTPEEITALLADAGLRVTDLRGLALSPTRGFVLGGDMRLNYLLTAEHG